MDGLSSYLISCALIIQLKPLQCLSFSQESAILKIMLDFSSNIVAVSGVINFFSAECADNLPTEMKQVKCDIGHSCWLQNPCVSGDSKLSSPLIINTIYRKTSFSLTAVEWKFSLGKQDESQKLLLCKALCRSFGSLFCSHSNGKVTTLEALKA